MPSYKPQAPHSFLHRALSDGAKPFRYRSGVRSLLGIPDSEGSRLAFSPTLPPVGFRYANTPFVGEPYITEDFPRDTERSAFHEAPRSVFDGSHASAPQDIQHRAATLIEAVKSVQSRLAEEKDINQNPGKIKDKAPQSETALESKREKVAVRAVEKSEQPDTTIEKAKIEIPGVSEKSLYFPALALSKKDDIAPSHAGERYQEKDSSADARGNSITHAKSETQGNEPIIQPGTHTVDFSATLQKGKVKNRIVPTSSAGGLENPVPIEAEFATEERRKFYPYRASGTSRLLDADTVNPSNQGAAERIEQLRQAVHELTAKQYAKSAEQERAYEETQTHQPRQSAPPPAQPVVVIKRFANPVRTPCAFWERSYLGRFRLRPLR